MHSIGKGARSLLVIVALFASFGFYQPAQAVGETVQVYLSSDNGQYELSQQANLTFVSSAGSATTTINVDPSTSYQSILGIGGSFDPLTIHHLNRMNAATRASVLESLIDPVDGIGYSLIRICFGTPDATLSPWYSYADVQGPEGNPLANFSIQKDIDNGILSVLNQAKGYNSEVKFFASSWSAPGWMKSSNSMVGGYFGSGWANALAEYFRRAVQAYEAQGIPIHAVTIQNEPGVDTTYPSMVLSELQEGQIVNELTNQFDQYSIGAKIWIFDQSYPSTQYFVDTMLDRTSSQWPYVYPNVDGIAFHDYEGDPGEMTRVHNKYPDKEIHMTEKSAGWQVDVSSNMITSFRNWSQSWSDWVTVSDETGDNNGPWELTGLVINSSTDANAITYTSGYYHFGQFSKFVRPGAVRIASDEGSGSTVRTVAFRNPDGQRVLVVTNETESSQSFKVTTSENGQFLATIPARTTGTYLWAGSAGSPGGNSTAKVEAENYSSQSGTGLESTSDTGGGQNVGWIDGNDYLAYDDLDFGSGKAQVSLRFATETTTSGNQVEFRLDSTTGPLIATVNTQGTGGWQSWTTLNAAVSGASGVRDLYLVFKGGSDIGNVNWFGFSDTATPLSRSGWSASASSTPSDPCCSGDTADKAIDSSASTRWSTGQGQSNGQYFQIDMGAAQSFSRIVVDAGSSSGDYPRGYQVFVSNDGTNWGSAISSGSGSAQSLTISFSSQNARYIRIVQTGSAGNWWSIHDMNVYP
jgi:glucosylceramidase